MLTIVVISFIAMKKRDTLGTEICGAPFSEGYGVER